MSGGDQAKVWIDPNAASWGGLVGTAEQTDIESQTFRAQMGLPPQTPLILTGHQATFWHPGILAKYFAAEAAARAFGGAVAWLVVDQDAQDFGAIEIPALTEGGLLRRQTVRLGPPPPIDAAAASCASFAPQPGGAALGKPALGSIQSGIAAITERLRERRGEATAARQVGLAVADLISDLVPRRPVFFATDLQRTNLMQRLVERMRQAPLEMAEAYNAALAAHPEARVAALQIDGDRVELPLWRLRPGAPRARVWSDDAALDTPDQLAPRALFMTGMLRMAGCELFIHGRGGGLYDRITDAWLGAWLDAKLAPTAVVSADLALPLGGSGVSEQDVARAKWAAHRALHDPETVGDREAAAAKRAWLARIADARASGADSSAPYRDMHRALEQYRAQHEGSIQALRDAAAKAERELANEAIAGERAWAFPLHTRAALEALRDQLFASFGVETRGGCESAAVSRPA